MTTKLPLTLLLTVFGMQAASIPSACTPNFQQDGMAIPVGCPNLSYQIVALPGEALVSVNDNPLTQKVCPNGMTGDCDGNDGSVNVTITSAGGNLENVIMSWNGGLSAWDDSIELGGFTIGSYDVGTFFVGQFLKGSLLDFQEIAQDGHVYDSLNEVGANWFWEGQVFSDSVKGSSTPEPDTLWAGVLLLALFSALRTGRMLARSRYQQ